METATWTRNGPNEYETAFGGISQEALAMRICKTGARDQSQNPVLLYSTKKTVKLLGIGR